MDPVFIFGPYRLDPRTRSLHRNGEPIELTPKMLDVLLLLVRNAGRLVQKEEFFRAVWPETVVEENNLSVTISKLRSVLEERAGARRYIETVPRRGYRFRAIVREQRPDGAALAPPEARNFRSSLPRIAVLPLECAPEDEFMADGVLEALVTALGRIRALRAISHQSVRRFRGSSLPLREVMEALEVDFVVEGSVIRSGELLRTSLRMLDARDDQLWCAQYDGSLLETLNAAGEAARAVARQIAVALAPGEETDVSIKNSVGAEALELYLRGRYFLQRNNEASIRKGRYYYLAAIEREPGYAAAYAGASHAAFMLGLFGVVPVDEAMQESTRLAERAIELDPTLSEAYIALGLTHEFFTWDWEAAEHAFRQAITLSPAGTTARHELGALLTRTGRCEEGLAEIERALALDPLHLVINHGGLAEGYYYSGQYEAAIASSRRSLELEPDAVWPRVLLGLSCVQMGRLEEGLTALRQAAEATGGVPLAVGSLGYGYAVGGDREAAAEQLRALAAHYEQGADATIFIAFVHLGLGERDEAIAWFERAFTSRSSWILWLVVDPRLHTLRRHPAIATLLQRLGLPASRHVVED